MPVISHPIVGRVRYEPLPGGRIRLLDGWGESNVETVFVPQLKGVPTYGDKFSGRVPFYRQAVPQLLAAFREVEAAGLKHRIIFWGGSWVPRMKRGSRSSPSNHTFATAFDINPAQNGFRQQPAQRGELGYLRDAAQIFKKHGFAWGGDWRNVPDGMHLEVARIVAEAPVKIVEPPVPPVYISPNGTPLENARMVQIGGTPTLFAPVRATYRSLGYDLYFVRDAKIKNRFLLKARERGVR